MANNTGSNYTSTTYLDPYKLAKEQYDSVDEQAILDKYNQATAAQFAAQQNQNMIAENNFYNQMYNTQRTAMDTIRQSNAAAVSTGASRGMQAANELSALLGLQQESIASATELANARRQTAQEETAAMLQNIVQASQDAANQRQQALNAVIQAQSLKATEGQTEATKQNTETERQGQKLSAIESGGATAASWYAQEATNQGYTETYSPEALQHHTEAAQYIVNKLPSGDTLNSDYWDTPIGNKGTIVENELMSNKPTISAFMRNELGLTDKNIADQSILNPMTGKVCKTIDEWITDVYLGQITANYIRSVWKNPINYANKYDRYTITDYGSGSGAGANNRRAQSIQADYNAGIQQIIGMWVAKNKPTTK